MPELIDRAQSRPTATGQDLREPAATPAGCRVLAGDLDYVANPRIIRECYDDGWEEWERRISSLLTRAEGAGVSGVSLYGRSRRFAEPELLGRIAKLAGRWPHLRCLLHFFDADTPSRIACAPLASPILNYVSGESWALAQIVRSLARRPLPLVVQPIGDAGIPATAAGRMRIVEQVARVLEGIGVAREQIHVDALSPAHGALPYPLRISLETIRAARQAGFSTILWPANAGLGHPRRDIVAATFATLAVQAGLDWAVVSLSDQPLLDAIAAANQLNGSPNGYTAIRT